MNTMRVFQTHPVCVLSAGKPRTLPSLFHGCPLLSTVPSALSRAIFVRRSQHLSRLPSKVGPARLWTIFNQAEDQDVPATTIPRVKGKQYQRGAKGYDTSSYQYATSSYETDNRTSPGLVVYAQNESDISEVIKYAKANNLAVAVRTGGHQYDGASSTTGRNIQLDLSTTFKGIFDEAREVEFDGKTCVRTSVSWSLADFSKRLGKLGVFVPHGQCTDVHLGGHVQTGGYGQLGRSFGLLGDHIRSIRLVDHEGEIKEVTKASDPDLFYGLLGGSPGNLGVITYVTIEVHKDGDYKGSRGQKAIYLYSKEKLKYLLDILVEMSDNLDFPPNYDYCVSVLSKDWNPFAHFKEINEDPIDGEDPEYRATSVIVVYAQWVPFDGDVVDLKWFQQFDDGALPFPGFRVQEKKMSELTPEWLFAAKREFELPYIKRTHTTRSTTVTKDGWSSFITDQIDSIVNSENCKLSAQLQNFGGNKSRFHINANNGTSFSWRDSTLVCTLDLFYKPGGLEQVEKWHQANDEGQLGPNGNLSPNEDRRVLWGSYGSFDLDSVWKAYYDDQAKYDKLREIRRKADPNGVFTPNTFAVKK